MAEAATTEQFQASWQVVKNVDSMEIPPFAVVQVWTADPAKKLIEVKRPTADSLQTVMIVANAPDTARLGRISDIHGPRSRLDPSQRRNPVTGDNWEPSPIASNSEGETPVYRTPGNYFRPWILQISNRFFRF